MPNPLLIPVLGWLRRLSHPRLFALTGALFLVTLVVPDPIPFVDELLLGLGTIAFANWKSRRSPDARDGSAPRKR
ncbi:MAG TPA: DUF6116 family protein [Luteimonas sp.]|nr:DUF6116 family protein [Luteimonas sp.]